MSAGVSRGVIGFIFFLVLPAIRCNDSKVARPRCPNCGWPFFTDPVTMERSENPVAMCTRCHAIMEVPPKKKKETQ
jgi:hypothetical protein